MLLSKLSTGVMAGEYKRMAASSPLAIRLGFEPLIRNKDVNWLTNEASNELLVSAVAMILKGMELDKQ